MNIFILGLLKLCILIQIFRKRFESTEQYQLFTKQFQNNYIWFELAKHLEIAKNMNLEKVFHLHLEVQGRGYMLQTTTYMLLRIS